VSGAPTEGGFVDWGLAERLALAVGGDGASPRRGDDPFGQAAIEAACEEAGNAVVEYSRLTQTRPPVPVVAIGRPEWVRAALASLREVAARAEPRLADTFALPGPLGGIARTVAGSAAGVEAGVAVGYASHRVLGQYDVSLIGSERPPRVLFVSPNLSATHARLGESAALFLRWIALHEIAHAVQFDAVPWLQPHVGALATELLDGALEGLGADDLRRAARALIRTDPRQVIRTLFRGDLVRALTGPEQRARLDALQAAMSLVEGHAEHVMDAAGAGLDPGYARLRERLEAHRSSLRRYALDQIIVRLLGLDLKLRQYRLGKAFCDSVVDSEGVDGLNRAWTGPEALPTFSELERPTAWLERVSASVAA
jgi:coenzyme F420 biosynthesis associated uncharacterized protein